MLRTIVKIDEEKCDGCGVCVPSCAEGAIQIVDGKAKLVSEIYCDGLGACLGECPLGAISMEEREAAQFDEEAVEEHIEQLTSKLDTTEEHSSGTDDLPCGCPGSASRVIERTEPVCADTDTSGQVEIESTLGNWPVQIKLIPVEAPYLQGAKILIAADCVPFAFADFHRKVLAGRTLMIGCPKLDESDFYREKLTEIFKRNDIDSVEVAYMEVPCCFGLVHLVKGAIQDSGKGIPAKFTKFGIRGDVHETVEENANVGV